MLEPLNPNEGTDRPAQARDAARPVDAAPLTDREVPLPGSEALGGTPLAVHAWLDGDASEADARMADPRQVALWNRIAEETASRRRMTTPAYMQARIMDALPESRIATATAAATATTAPLVAPAVRTDERIALSPVTAAIAAAGLVAAGFLLGRLLN